MKITHYRYKKDALLMYSRSIESLVNTLQAESTLKQVSVIRDSFRAALPGRPDARIQLLPALVFGATCRRSGEQIQMNRYNGCILLEVNGLYDVADAENIRREAAGMPQTLLAFVGLSGRSVKIVVPFTLPDGSLPRKEEKARLFHAAAYQLAVKHYQPQLSSMIALKEPLLMRGCRISYDPGVYYNPAAVAIRIEQPLQMPPECEMRIVPNPSADPLERLVPGVSYEGRIATLYSVVLMEAIRIFGKTESNDVESLFIELAQNCSKLGIPEEEAVGWTLRYDALKLHETAVRATFRSAYLLKKIMSGGTLFPAGMSLVMQLEEFMERRYFFRQNEMSGEVEYLDRSVIQFTYRPYTSKVRNTICMEAQKEGLNVWDKDIDRYVHSEQVPMYHPIEYYLDNLPAWDGKDHIRLLADRIPCSNPKWRDQFFRWFLSMVAHWLGLDREHGNSTTPLLVGDQGCGKSTFCLNLLPHVLRPFYTDSIDFGNRREAELALNRYALINIDEFDSVRPSHQSFLKHILQKATVNTRLPYQSAARSLRRYATFIATSNNFDLLTDPTGSRRFICVEIAGVIDYLQPIDYEQLYAQAREMLKREERFWFTHEEEAEIVESNRCFQQQPAEEQLFLQYFKPSPDMETGRKPLLAVEILDRIAQKRRDFVVTKTMILTFGKLLKRNNVLNKRTTRGYCYYVDEVNP